MLGFVKKINVGIVSLGLSLALGLVGGVKANVIFAGFPGKLFITLLGTMFLFCLLQENKTLELLSKKMVVLVGKHTYLIPILIYLSSFILSAAGPGAISVQSVMIIFAVSLSVQMNASPILMGGMAILGAVGGTAHSTRGSTLSCSSKVAIRTGIAPDGGLFVSDELGTQQLDISSLGR